MISYYVNVVQDIPSQQTLLIPTAIAINNSDGYILTIKGEEVKTTTGEKVYVVSFRGLHYLVTHNKNYAVEYNVKKNEFITNKAYNIYEVDNGYPLIVLNGKYRILIDPSKTLDENLLSNIWFIYTEKSIVKFDIGKNKLYDANYDVDEDGYKYIYKLTCLRYHIMYDNDNIKYKDIIHELKSKLHDCKTKNIEHEKEVASLTLEKINKLNAFAKYSGNVVDLEESTIDITTGFKPFKDNLDYSNYLSDLIPESLRDMRYEILKLEDDVEINTLTRRIKSIADIKYDDDIIFDGPYKGHMRISTLAEIYKFPYTLVDLPIYIIKYILSMLITLEAYKELTDEMAKEIRVLRK